MNNWWCTSLERSLDNDTDDSTSHVERGRFVEDLLISSLLQGFTFPPINSEDLLTLPIDGAADDILPAVVQAPPTSSNIRNEAVVVNGDDRNESGGNSLQHSSETRFEVISQRSAVRASFGSLGGERPTPSMEVHNGDDLLAVKTKAKRKI